MNPDRLQHLDAARRHVSRTARSYSTTRLHLALAAFKALLAAANEV
jgi:hypothetical protein